MSVQKRRELYNICRINKIPIIEIDEFRDFHPNPLPPLKAMDEYGIIVYMGTFSSILSRSINVGWISASKGLISHIASVNLAIGQNYNTFQQHIVYEALSSGEYHRYTTSLQNRIQERKAPTNGILETHLRGIADWKSSSDIFLRFPIPLLLSFQIE
jgi:GntR family transcriptional regulator of abcA and norABC